MLVVPGQPAYTLVEKEKDSFGAAELPDTYRASFKRAADGNVSAMVLKQPEGEFELKRTVDTPAAAPNMSISVDELMAKVIAAAGGEANLRKHRSLISTAFIEFENQGVTGEIVSIAKAPNASASTTTIAALGKKIATIRDYFDGTSGGEETSFAPPEVLTDKQLEDTRIASDFSQLANWKTLFKNVTIQEKSKVGEEDVYVVVKTPEKGNAVTEYVSTTSFLVLKRETLRATLGGDGPAPVSETYSDYRNVDGWMVPFTTTSKVPGLGSVITRLKDVKFDVDLPDAEFRSNRKQSPPRKKVFSLADRRSACTGLYLNRGQSKKSHASAESSAESIAGFDSASQEHSLRADLLGLDRSSLWNGSNSSSD